MVGASIIPFPAAKRNTPDAGELVKRIHALSVDGVNVRMNEPHFGERLVDRGIDMRSVLEVLRRGRSVGKPQLDEYGDWRMEMRRKVAG